ncbi:uncharacterized protein LOC134854903 isoform X4 [Symsagittifera roscoffensis]|uniref:uncharacterized protein LOC134854903 isoform X4 n=1 Tax=Symsagittifera roscoffensis TaxID=84072 RepID=UPI00307B6563
MKSFKFFALLAIGVMCSALTQRRTQFELENNGYSGLLIAINDEILPSQDFLDGIERTWIDFSEALFNSTGRRAYFNQVVVSLPSTWDHFNFSNISSTSEFSSASSKQGIDWANVIVSERNPSFADAPYTKQTGECGEPGEYIHLTEKFVTDERYTKQAFGNVGKLLVREWGHLRWGLFDESGSSDQSPTKLFYHGMDGSLHPTRCSAQIRGKPQDAVTGGKCEIGLETDLPSDTCMFMPDRDQPEGVTGSVMFMHSLPQITEFCDDEPDTPAGRRHNSEAPNKHNAMCNGRSAWSVMRDHPDFKDGNNAAVPADVIKDVKPKFKYVVQRPKEIVFVIDVSTRENVDKTNEIRQAVGNYIMNQVPLGSKVGLVAFASEATQLSAMTSLRNESDRARLLTHLYNDTLLTEKYTTEERGKTSIGSGLSSAIAMISGGQGGGFSSGDASDSSDPRLTDICLSYLREQTFDASLLSQLPEDISAKDLLTICQSPFYKDQLISSSGGKFDPSDINGDGALISVACEYYSQNGKLSNDHLIKYLELYPKKSYSDLEDTCKAQLISGSGGDGISGNSGIEAIVRAACEHYLVNSDFTTEQILQLKKLFPERTAYKQLTELCEDPDLISGGAGGNGGGAGSSGSRDAMVKEACDYYRANEDFTAEQLFALKSAFPNRSLKEITELCADGELISGSDGEGGVNPSREAIVKEACDYYSLNSDFTTKQYESLKQLYPERTTFKQLTELCDNELISGLDGEGGSDPSGEATVKLACEYYSVNSDFTTKQMEDLKRLYPDRTSFKQLAELCKNDELISGDSGDSKPSDSEIVKRACEYYAVHKDFTREQATDLMEKFTDLSFNELPSLCSDSDLISGDSGDSNPSESEIVKQACEYYAVHKDFTRDQINDLMDKFTDLSFNELPSLCSDSGGGNGAKITLEASCVEYKEEGKLNLKTIENEFKMNLMQFMSKCDEIYPPSSRKRRQSRAVQSELAEKCAEWKEHLDSTDDETDAVYQIVKQSYERDCIENDRVKRSEKSEKCSELEKQLDDAEDSGNDFLVELLKEKLQTDCVEIERVKRSEKSEKCWGLEKELETAEKNGNDIIVEVLKEKIQADCVEEIERVKREEKNDKCIQMEKELEDAKAIGSAEFVLEMIRDKIQTDCAELHRRIIRAAESAECRELKVRFEDAVKDGDAFLEKTFKENFNSKCKEVKRTERDAKSDECEQLEKELEDAKARNKPEFMLQMIEDKIQTDCVEEYERLKRTAKSEECLALEKELADAEATGKTFLVQILKENIKTTCTEDSSESGGSGAACAKQQEDLDKAMRQGVEDYLLDVLRRALLDCKAHNTEESSGGSVATACAKQQDALDKVISQGGDESLIDVLQKALLDCKAEYTENDASSSSSSDCLKQREDLEDGRERGFPSNVIDLLQKDLDQCLAKSQVVVDPVDGSGDSKDCSSKRKSLEEAVEKKYSAHMIDLLQQDLNKCLSNSGGGVDGGSAASNECESKELAYQIAMQDSSLSEAQKQLARGAYFQCLEANQGVSEGGDGGQGGEGVDCSAWEVMYDNAMKSGTSELIELSRKSLEECRARATKEGGSGGDGTLSCKDIRQLYTSTSDVNVRNMLMQKNAACLTDLDESEIDGGDSNTGVTTCSHFSTVLASMEADPNSDSAAIKSVKDQYEKCLEQGGIDTNGGSGNALASCDSIMDTIKMMQANGGDSGETELIRKLQAQYSKCVAEGGADISGLNEAGSKDNTCATLSSAIDGLSQTVKTDPSPANQESLRSLTASFRTLGCTGNQNADSDYGNYGAISGKNAHEIVLITSYQDSMDVESTITDVDTKGLQEAGVSLTVVHARQFSYIQLMRVINYNNATLFDLSLEKGSNLKGTPGSLFTLQSQDLDAKSAMILQKQVTLNKPFKNLDAETNKTMPIAKFESFNNITTVTVDGGKFLRVIFALDISRLTAKDRVQYPAITVKAPFAPVKGRKSGSQSSFSFSPDSYKDGESDVVKKFNETNTVRFMIPLEGRKAIGNWTITVFEDLSKPEISGQLLVDIPASNPLVIDPPKENKKSTASEPTNENTENEAETEAEKAKRSSELFMEDDIIPESKSEDVGAELQSPVELMDDDEATSEDAEMDPKAARAKLIQKHLDEKNGPIVRLSGKIVEEKRSKMKKVVAELTWGDYHAILDAEVKVMFECGTAGDKTNTRNKDETSRTITLLDNGANGDVTAGDGVYSGFFVYTSKMRCSGRLVATGVQGGPQHLRDLGRVSTVDMAPGVIFTREAEQTVPAFRRELVLESFDNSAGQTTSEVDKIAPARVIDLALVDSSLSKRTVQMKFTRSGDDLDKVTIGKMVQYDIRISANLTEMYLNFDSCFQLKPEHLVDTRIMPDFTTPYTLPMFTFTVPEDVWLQSTSKVFAVGLRANDTLNSSPVSNVVIVALKDPPTTFVPVFIAALLLIAFILLSTLFYVVRRAARKSANSQGKIYIHVPNLNKKRGMGGKMGGHGRKGGSQEVDIESMPKLNTTSQVCVDSY